MRYIRPSTEVEAVQWTGTNIQELWDRFGAGNIYGPTERNEHPTLTPQGCPLVEGIPLEAVGDWVIGNRTTEHGWALARLSDEQFQSLGYKPAYRDRTENYVPEGLYLDGRPQHAEISAPTGWITPEWMRRMIETAATLLTGAGARLVDAGQDVGPIRQWLNTLEEYDSRDRPPRMARVAHGQPDEYNRDHGTWWWADVSGNGTHWARFQGHRVQVDVELHTNNHRDVNSWKGRDEIRAGGTWLIKLNRQVVYGDDFGGTDVPAVLRRIERKLSKLLGEDWHGIDLHSDVPFAEQLTGRRIYYRRTPAVVTSTVLDQGCVIIKPVGVAAFPRSASDLDSEPDGSGHDEQDLHDEGEERSLKVHLDSPDIWWWRRRPYSADEPDERYRPSPKRAGRVMVEASPDEQAKES